MNQRQEKNDELLYSNSSPSNFFIKRIGEGKDQQDAIIDKLVQIEFDQAKYARELILLDADLKTRQKEKDKKEKIKDVIKKSILGRYIDKKILELKSTCETVEIEDLVKQVKTIAGTGCDPKSHTPLCDKRSLEDKSVK